MVSTSWAGRCWPCRACTRRCGSTPRRWLAANAPGAVATDLAELLVVSGMAFREAHAVVGALVRRSLDEGVALVDLVAEEPRLGPRAVKLFEPGASVANRTTPGGAGHAPVSAQLKALTDAVAASAQRWVGWSLP